MTVFGVVLLLITFVGFAVAIKDLLGLRSEFIPAVICSSISLVLFFTGLCGSLIVGTVLVIACGVALTLWYAIKRRNAWRIFTKRDYLILGAWIAVIFTIATACRDFAVYHNDNYTHWAAVVKVMLLSNKMPVAQDYMVQYQEYPLASSLFLYFVTRITVAKESVMIIAQQALLISFLLPMASFVKRKNLIAIVPVLFYFVFAYVANNRVTTDLLVDTLMPAVAVGILSVLAYYKNVDDGRSLITGLMVTIPMFYFLLNIKNSGIFFVLCVWVYLLINYRKSLVTDTVFKRLLIFDFALPVITVILWRIRLAVVFPDSKNSNHAVSVNYYQNIFHGKTSDDIQDIARMLGYFQVNETILLLLLISELILIVVLCSYVGHEVPRSAIAVTAVPLLIYVLYVFSLLGMYIFSMPYEEAKYLVSYDRYIMSLMIFIIGLSQVLFLSNKSKTENKIVAVIVACLSIIPVIAVNDNARDVLSKPNYDITIRKILDDVIDGHDSTSANRYLIYSDMDNVVLERIARYELWCDNVDVCSSENVNSYATRLNDYDYLIIVMANNDERIQFLNDTGYSDYYDSSVSGAFIELN